MIIHRFPRFLISRGVMPVLNLNARLIVEKLVKPQSNAISLIGLSVSVSMIVAI